MSYPSINRRSIVVPELDVILHAHTIELPLCFSSLLQGKAESVDSESVDSELSSFCQEIFDASWVDVISYSRWKHITTTLKGTFDDSEYLEQIPKIYGGSDTEKTNQILEWIYKQRGSLQVLLNHNSSVSGFGENLLKTGLLDPRRLRKPTGESLSPFSYTEDPSLLHDFHGISPNLEILELEMKTWQAINDSITLPILPSTKMAFQELSQYDVPFSSSPPIKAQNLKDFVKLTRGAAWISMASAPVNVAHVLSQPVTTNSFSSLAFCVFGSSAAALVFFSVGQAAIYIEDRLEHYLKRNAPRPKKLKQK